MEESVSDRFTAEASLVKTTTLMKLSGSWMVSISSASEFFVSIIGSGMETLSSPASDSAASDYYAVSDSN